MIFRLFSKRNRGNNQKLAEHVTKTISKQMRLAEIGLFKSEDELFKLAKTIGRTGNANSFRI